MPERPPCSRCNRPIDACDCPYCVECDNFEDECSCNNICPECDYSECRCYDPMCNECGCYEDECECESECNCNDCVRYREEENTPINPPILPNIDYGQVVQETNTQEDTGYRSINSTGTTPERIHRVWDTTEELYRPGRTDEWGAITGCTCSICKTKRNSGEKEKKMPLKKKGSCNMCSSPEGLSIAEHYKKMPHYQESTKYLCKDCYKKYYSRCPECDRDLQKDEFVEYNIKEKKGLVCGDCAHIAYKSIKNYTYKPKPGFKPFKENTKKTLYLGVELEVENMRGKEHKGKTGDFLLKEVNKEKKEDNIYLKNDSSLRKGFEIVTQPMTLDIHNGLDWERILNILRSRGFMSHNTSSCGLHVHINKNYLNKIEITRLNLFVSGHPNEMVKIARRFSSSYAPIKKIDKKQLRGGFGTHASDRDAINFTSRNTIEFRLFKGTLNYKSFMASLQFVDSVTKFVKTNRTPMFYSKSKSWETYVKFLKKNKYKILLEYMKRKNILKPKFDIDNVLEDPDVSMDNERIEGRYIEIISDIDPEEEREVII